MVVLTTDLDGDIIIDNLPYGGNCYIKDTITDVNDTAIDLTGKTINIYVRRYFDSTAESDLQEPIPVLLSQSTNTGQYVFNITPAMTLALGRGIYMLECKYTHTEVEISKLIAKVRIV